MHRVIAPVRAPAIAATTLLAIFGHGAAAAAEGPWWQRIDGFVSAGIGEVRARPQTGGTITKSFNDVDTVGLDKSIVGGSGLATDDWLPLLQLGARVEVIDNLNVGLEGQYYAFSDFRSAPPADAPDVAPQPNFATYTESSTFKLRARDIGATVGYSRWGGTAEAMAGFRDGSFRTRAEIHSFGMFTTGNFINLLLANGSAFKGDGAVFGLRLSYRLPQIPLRIVARYSYSDLDGKSDSFGRAAGTVVSNPSTPLSGAATVTRNNADARMKIHDQEYGLQYEFGAASMRSFVRASWLQTSWKINGLPTGGAGFGGTIGDLTTNSFASGGLGEAKVRGAMLTVGVNF